jgi:TolB-like protein
MIARLRLAVSLLLSVLAVPPSGLSAQCPDGTPHPCAGRAPRRDGIRMDSTTALVMPLAPLGGAAALRALGTTVAAAVAENLTVGDVRGALFAQTAPATPEARLAAARRLRAGALVDGSLLAIGPRVRATVRLVTSRDARVVTTVTVEESADSVLAMTDRASLVLLREWWRVQPGARLRGGVVTSSLPALRHYVEAMRRWGRGETWRAALDSAIGHDSAFVAAWLWLALASPDYDISLGMGTSARSAAAAQGIITPDSASRSLQRLLARLDALARRQLAGLPTPELVAGLARASLPVGNAFLCRGAGSDRTVEVAYVNALRARLATLIGCEPGDAVAAARSAVQLDSTFSPALRLLAIGLTDLGDTADARGALDRLPAADSAWVRRMRHVVAARLGPLPPDTASDAPVLALGWHRYQDLRLMLPRFEQAISGTPGPLRDAAVPVVRLALLAPVQLARGQRDSAATTTREGRDALARLALGPRGTPSPALQWQLLGSLPFMDADSLLLPPPLDSGQTAALVASVRTMQVAGGTSAAVITQRALMRTTATRTLWLHGVLALQRGEPVAARRFADLLDSLAAEDSLLAAPLGLGLRADILLAEQRADSAQRLLRLAIGLSASATPSRYRLLLARTLADSDPEQALRLAASLTMASGLHGLDNPPQVGPALRLEAELLERLGRTADAAARYRAFVDLWRDADAPLQPQVAEARAALARLER